MGMPNKSVFGFKINSGFSAAIFKQDQGESKMP
jgi:hypothetical protein